MLKLIESKSDSVTLISSLDEALAKGSDWTAYRETLDEAHLVLSGEPTRFKVRGITQAMQNACLDLTPGGAAAAFQAFAAGSCPLSYMRELARYAVAGVDNPDPSWPKPVMIRERGYEILSREVVDSLPDTVCIEIALLCRQLQAKAELLKKK